MRSTQRSLAGAERQTAGDARLRVSQLRVLRAGAGVEAMETFRCRRCGDVIGVYEPLVICTQRDARMTSRAAEPDMKATGDPHYHRACYAAKTDEE